MPLSSITYRRLNAAPVSDSMRLTQKRRAPTRGRAFLCLVLGSRNRLAAVTHDVTFCFAAVLRCYGQHDTVENF